MLTRCDGLALGSLMALLLANPEVVTRRIKAYRLGFAAAGLAAWFVPMLPLPGQSALDSWLFTSRASLMYFGLGGFVLCTQGHPWLAPLREKRLCHVGQISYGLYLFHPLVFATMPPLIQRHVMRRLGLQNPMPMNVLMIVVCFILAELSKRLVEDPIVALKDRIAFRGEKPSVYRGPHPSRPGPPGLSADGRHHEGSSPATPTD